MGKSLFFVNMFRYILHPEYVAESAIRSFAGKLWDITRVWSLGYVIALPLGFGIAILTQISGYNLSQNGVYELLSKESPVFLLALVALWAPLTEEVGFRLWLKYSPFRLSIAFGYWFYFIFSSVLNEHLFSQTFGLISTLLPFVLTAFVIIAMGFLIKTRMPQEGVRHFYERHFRLLFYVSSFTFGIAHLFNYDNFEKIWYLIPLLFLPQLIIGSMFGYVRMKYSLAWSFTTHAFYNVFLFLPQIFLQLLPAESQKALENNDIQKIMAESPNGVLVVLLIDAVFIFIVIVSLISFVQLLREIRTRRSEIRGQT